MRKWPGELRAGAGRWRPPFKAGWTETLKLLDRELERVGAREATIEIALHEMQFSRRTGLPFADADPPHPGVVVRFAKLVKTRQGKTMLPLVFKCDTYSTWKGNLRAIAIALEDLRRIDRYGVTSEAGDQWAGFKSLPGPGPAHDAIATVEQAAAFLADASVDFRGRRQAVIDDPAARRDAYRLAAAAVHPDAYRGADGPELWARLQAAKALLDAQLGNADNGG
jgi:hypothetical protein